MERAFYRRSNILEINHDSMKQTPENTNEYNPEMALETVSSKIVCRIKVQLSEPIKTIKAGVDVQ